MNEHSPEPQLRALVRVAAVLGGAHRLDEVLELVAEEALAVVPTAASAAVKRWEPEHDRLRTLVSVSELAPGGKRWPADESWPLVDLPFDRDLLDRGRPYVLVAGRPGLPERNALLLEQLGTKSHVAVPIVVEGRPWGSLEAFSGPGLPPFADGDVALLEALAAHASAAIERAELFARLNALAYEDPLTGLPNRRALDERLEAAVTRAAQEGGELSLIFFDLDGLKEINDERGHDAGDRALSTASDALAAAVAAVQQGFLARLGGDEFCVLLVGAGADAARALALDASSRVAEASDDELTFSCGVASVEGPDARSADLLRAADAAQYAAKRLGRNRVFVAETGVSTVLGRPDAQGVPRRGRRRLRDTEPRTGALVRSVLHSLEHDLAGADAARRLAALALASADTFDLAGWSVSTAAYGDPLLHTVFEGGRRTHRVSGAPSLAFATDEAYSLADYPTTADALEAGGWFTVDVEDEQADPKERELLERLAYTSVLGVAVRGEHAAHLLELFTDRSSDAVAEALPEMRLLALAAVSGTGGNGQPASGSPLESAGGS